MWLINVRTRKLEEFIGTDVPQYAILSHTWARGEEVTFQEMRHPEAVDPAAPRKAGWLKIDYTCKQAAQHYLHYAWVDTCCIDKSSSAELSEAINSMFQWYKRAAVCYVFLQDLGDYPVARDGHTSGLEATVKHCRWFTRSWTLQELIAPLHMNFYNRDWKFFFTKAVASEVLGRITGIDVGVLSHEKDLSAVSVAQKMSWASSRQATRKEDVAYSLLGIFGINMPMLYGEEERAFFRLQAEIISSCPDTTVFAWMLPHKDSGDTSQEPSNIYGGVMASSPAAFRLCAEAVSWSGLPYDFSMSNRGIKLRARFGLLLLKKGNNRSLVLPVCRIREQVYGIRMRNTGGACFVRQDTSTLFPLGSHELPHPLVFEPYLLKEIPPEETGKSVVMNSRQRVLEVVLPPSIQVTWRWPWQEWDEQDSVFFGTNGPSEVLGWASLKVLAYPDPSFINPDDQGNISILFYALDWTSDPSTAPTPQYTIHRVRGKADARALEQMNNDAVTNSWNSKRVGIRLSGNSISNTHFLVAGEREQEALILTCDMSRAEDVRKCLNPFWRVTFSWSIIPKNQVPIGPITKGFPSPDHVARVVED